MYCSIWDNSRTIGRGIPHHCMTHLSLFLSVQPWRALLPARPVILELSYLVRINGWRWVVLSMKGASTLLQSTLLIPVHFIAWNWFLLLIIYLGKFQSAPTFLRQGHYSTLYPTSDSKKSWTHRATYTYQAGQKIVWSITPKFPSNSCFLDEPYVYISQFYCLLSEASFFICSSNKSISLIEGLERDGKLFKNIVKSTNKVAIGPLEYCGNAHVIQGPHGRELYVFFYIQKHKLIYKHVISVAVVRGDTQIPEYFAIRLLKGMNRRSAVKPGKQKRAMTQSSRTALKKRVPLIYQERPNTSFEDNLASSDPSSSDTSFSNIPLSQCNLPLPQKRRRLCVDKHLVVGEKENIYEEDMGKRRRSCRSTST